MFVFVLPVECILKHTRLLKVDKRKTYRIFLFGITYDGGVQNTNIDASFYGVGGRDIRSNIENDRNVLIDVKFCTQGQEENTKMWIHNNVHITIRMHVIHNTDDAGVCDVLSTRRRRSTDSTTMQHDRWTLLACRFCIGMLFWNTPTQITRGSHRVKTTERGRSQKLKKWRFTNIAV